MSPGQLIAGRYELRGVLGRGGMGEVYLALDQRLAMDVALKRVPQELALDPNIRQALVKEARILARLSHSHIVRLFDLAETEDDSFLVLEFVCGPGLDRVLAQRPLRSLPEVQYIIGQVAQALDLAHSLGVFHRDLKPSNLLVDLAGEERRQFLQQRVIPPTLEHAQIKVADFGLAKVVRELSQADASGVISGTPAYMAPEQFRGELPSPETDVYALGLIAYECLSGSAAIGTAQPVYFHLFGTPAPLTGVPAHVNAAILKAISKDRADRFHSALAFAEALRLPTPVTPPPIPASVPPKPQPAPPPPRPPGSAERDRLRRRRVLLASTALLLLLFTGIAATSYLSGTRTNKTSGSPVEEVTTKAVNAAPVADPLPMPDPAPRIEELPPVIESARNNTPAALVAPLPPGITRPAILAQAYVTGDEVQGFGPDETLYLSNGRDHTFGAIHDGRQLWQYRIGINVSHFLIAPDGLIWIVNYSNDRLFCFNAHGGGGELAGRLLQTSKAHSVFDSVSNRGSSPTCVDPDQRDPDPGLAGPRSSRGIPAWRTKLDHRCQGSPVVGASDGKILVQTEARTLYLASPEGRVLWTYNAPCDFQKLTLLADDTAVGACSTGDKQTIGVRDGQLRFSDTHLPKPELTDRDGSYYGFQSTEQYDRHLLQKLSSEGKVQWTVPLQMPISPKLSLSPAGKLYLLSSLGGTTTMAMIGDKSAAH